MSDLKLIMTDRARRHLSGTLKQLSTRPELIGQRPLLSWVIGRSDELDFIPRLDLFFDGSSGLDQFQENFYLVEGEKVFLAVEEKILNECLSKVLDYRGSKLVLIYESDLTEMNSFDAFVSKNKKIT